LAHVLVAVAGPVLASGDDAAPVTDVEELADPPGCGRAGPSDVERQGAAAEHHGDHRGVTEDLADHTGGEQTAVRWDRIPNIDILQALFAELKQSYPAL